MLEGGAVPMQLTVRKIESLFQNGTLRLPTKRNHCVLPSLDSTPADDRKGITKSHRGLRKELISLVEPTAKDDPMVSLKWTSKSTRNLADALSKKWYVVSHATIGSRLYQLGYSLQANKKNIEVASYVDRDSQFRHINDGIIAAQKQREYRKL
jgi:hypothetical protein